MTKHDTGTHRSVSPNDPYGSVIPPIYLSAIYRYINEDYSVKSDRGLVVKYSREENPTLRVLERIIARLEGVDDSLAFASGMGAVSTALLSHLDSGMKVVVPKEMYSTTLQLLMELSERIGFKLVTTWPSAESIEEAVDKETALVLLEVMTNPTLKVIDLARLSQTLPLDRTLLIVDNTFTTPLLLKPAEFGARLVIHSTTKYLAGHNDVVGGVAAGPTKEIESLWEWRRMLGTTQAPFEAYLTIRGIKTLEVRFEKQCRTAAAVAEYLADHPRVEEVMYPGLSTDPYNSIAKKLFSKQLYGAVLSFKVKGSQDEAVKILKKLKVITPSPSLGGTESLITLAAASAARYIPPEDRKALGISDNLLRLSIGLEDPEELIEDLGRALS